MRTLGLDFGAARIGVAVSDATGSIAMPHAVIHEKNQGEQIRQVLAFVASTGAERLVVGLPLQMDGAHGEMAETVERFAKKLEAVTGLPVHRWDERLTSVAAERSLRDMGRSRNRRTPKGDVDKIAACLILQAFLDSPEARG